MLSELEQLGKEISDLENKRKTLSYRYSTLKLQLEMDSSAKYVEEKRVRCYESSDYAGLGANGLHFYYGYEVVDSEGDWCFEVKRGKDVLFKVSEKELNPKYNQDMLLSLLNGIGLYLIEQEKK